MPPRIVVGSNAVMTPLFALIPGAPSLAFLAYLLVLLPWFSLRSRGRLRHDDAATPLPISRTRIWAGTLLAQLFLLFIAWQAGRGFDYRLFAMPRLGARDALAAAVALAVLFAARAISRATRTNDERRRMIVYRLAPQSPREWVVWLPTLLVGSVAEEAAYRGVGMSILWYSLGSPWVAALICALAFATAHAIQGWKSGVVIFVMALAFHGLVEFTHTLVIAMVVHVVYDLVAGVTIARESTLFRSEA